MESFATCGTEVSPQEEVLVISPGSHAPDPMRRIAARDGAILAAMDWLRRQYDKLSEQTDREKAVGQLAVVVLVTLIVAMGRVFGPHLGHRDSWFYLNVFTLVLGLLGIIHATLVLLAVRRRLRIESKIPPKTL
jgi:hypothetical protein